MFLEYLSERQQQSFLALATRMVLADGDVAPEEDTALDACKATMGEGVTAPAAEIFGATNTEVLDSRQVRIFVTFEVLVLMISDQHIHTDESKVLDEICAALEISEQDLKILRGMVIRANSSPDAVEEKSIRDAVIKLADG